jgi:hypothetical protein
MECLEIGRLIVRRALLPTSIQDTDPLERQGTHSGLMRVALVTLLLIIDLGPEGMPNRLCGPLHKRLPEELWTLEPPVHPGFLAAAFGHRRDPRLFLQCSGGGIAFPLFAEGDEQPGRKDGARPREGLKQGKIGMVLGALRNGMIKGLDRVQGHAQLAHQRLDEQGIGSDDTLIRGQGRRGFDGAHTRDKHVCRAHMVIAKEGLQGGPPGQLCRFEGGPAAQKVTEHEGIFVLKPLQHLRDIVFQRTGETVRNA